MKNVIEIWLEEIYRKNKHNCIYNTKLADYVSLHLGSSYTQFKKHFSNEK